MANEQHPTYTLFELNALVRDVLEGSLPDTYWVEAEISEARTVRGHLFLDLIQKEPFSPTPVARASAKCWKSTWMRLEPRFRRITGQDLHAGMSVLLAVRASFHEAFGFSWIVTDIDPTFTLGDMARKRMEIVNQLKAEGVFDLQKELGLPLFAQHIAVISSEQAAGFGDFCDQLLHNDYGFFFHIELFPAIMQGDQVEESIIACLNQINDREGEFDAVVIIRGGGATSDLSGFDTLALAENVANFPLPIITGIGHERDESVLDMVSHTRVKTPTAAAAFLIDHLKETADTLDDCREQIVEHVRAALESQRRRLERAAEKIPVLFSLVRTREEARLDRQFNQLVTMARERLSDSGHRLDTLHRRLGNGAQVLLGDHRHRLDMLLRQLLAYTPQCIANQQHKLAELQLRINNLDPRQLLKRGYSITMLNGHALHDPAQLKAGDEIVTRLEKGNVISIVK
jgi:exodeoxyribonuclease VII large subunit